MRSPSLEEGYVHVLDSAAMSVGRGPQNDLALPDDDYASAEHARLEPRRDGIWLEDSGSTNGTYVNGVKVSQPRKLVPGDIVRVGETDFRFRDGNLEQLTEDHSLVAELVRSGKLSPEEAEVHPQRSVITRALGTDPDVDVDAFAVPTLPGDVFMLCSDGLSSMVPDDRILELVEKHRRDLKKAAKSLVDAANRSGGEDNITVVFFE